MNASAENLVSVLIPAHRAAGYLAATLESVAAQTHSAWELLVLEDGIFDETAEVVAAFAARWPGRVRFFRNEKNLGVSRARNRLLDEARGSRVAFLDADDIWMPDHLEASLALMEREDADWTIGGYNTMNAAGALMREDVLPPMMGADELPTALLRRNFILPSGMVLRTRVFADGLRFDPALKIGEDLDLCVQLVKAGRKPAYARHATLRYRKHAASATANSVRLPEEFSRVFEKYVNDPVVDRAVCRNMLTEFLLAVARMTWRREPERARAALRRLFRFRPWAARGWFYAVLAWPRAGRGGVTL
jgi:glycosyltransferase involved in cell wall biosynthesis